MTFYKIAILAVGLVFSAEQAFACSCRPHHQSAAEQAEHYPLIFVGTAMTSVDVTPAPPPIKRSFWQRLQFWKPAPVSPHHGSHSFTTAFQVKSVLKGEEADTITLHHNAISAMCGISFVKGYEYLILAYQKDDGTYSTGLCALPQFPLAEFEAALAPPATPLPSDGRPDSSLEIPSDLTALLGTWGADEAQCNLLQEERGAPFILTQNSFDQHETHCDTSFTSAEIGGWNMSMSCSVEGDLQTSEEWIVVYDGALLRSFDGGQTAQEFMRCADP